MTLDLGGAGEFNNIGSNKITLRCYHTGLMLYSVYIATI